MICWSTKKRLYKTTIGPICNQVIVKNALICWFARIWRKYPSKGLFSTNSASKPFWFDEKFLQDIIYVSKTCWSVDSQEFGENILLRPFFLPIGCQNAVDLIRIILRDILYVSKTCLCVDSQEFGENILLRPFFYQ